MALTYRRHSNVGPNWNRNSTFPPLSATGASHRAPSPANNHGSMQPGSFSVLKTSISSSPALSISRPTSERSMLYQSTSKSIVSPYSTIPTVSEEPAVNGEQIHPEKGIEEKASVKEEFNLVRAKEPAVIRTSVKADSVGKGKEPAVIRSRPIFHANLEEAKKYHQNRLKSLNGSSKKNPISCEEIISRYCDHFNFQLPILEVIRYKESPTTKKRVFLRIKRRLVGIGEEKWRIAEMLRHSKLSIRAFLQKLQVTYNKDSNPTFNSNNISM
ncbi:hypothetical protein H4Q26_012016 [Puccinia striiformis f. sp. tritici PST-130]|nr:hypothetical protein H4Q26_012016 [Puccinia striiformis f. sp. tritici PST-130]